MISEVPSAGKPTGGRKAHWRAAELTEPAAAEGIRLPI
jgi:hypothetical protein